MRIGHSELIRSKGWIFYDAACPLCQRVERALGPMFRRRGFAWEPLQTPGAAQRLGVSEQDLRAEMKLQLADRRVVGGLNSWIILMRSVWWLWPVGVLLSLPGFHALGQVGYRWIARHRCVGTRSCGKTRRRTIPFLDLP
jgi:predicted DCC family thiol-disulfide oxidoreductase YuxK